jgi:hypothetical protein
MEDSTEALGHSGNDGVTIHSGFPNPAAEQSKAGRGGLSLDLNALIVKNPVSTFYFQVEGSEWEGRGIYDGDIAVVDRALTPKPTDLVATWAYQTLMICRFTKLPKDAELWGVITAVIHPIRLKG